MAFDPDDRFPDCRALAKALEETAETLGLVPTASRVEDLVKELFPDHATPSVSEAAGVPTLVVTDHRIGRQTLIGRDDLLSNIQTAVVAGQHVELIGEPGVGKTSVARALAAWWQTEAKTAWICEQSKSDDDLLGSVSATLGHPNVKNFGELMGLVERRQALIVLDRADDVSEAAELCSAAAAHSVVVVMTSRRRLDLAVVINVDPLHEDDAMRLLESKGVSASPPELRALASFLEGNPLALELAAARLELMNAATLLDRLGKSAIDGLGRDSPLASAIRECWNALSQEEREALAACSMFRSRFTIDEAEQLVDASNALASIAALRAKSLLRIDRSDGGIEVPVVVREFAQQHAGDMVHARHAQLFARAAENGLEQAVSFGIQAIESSKISDLTEAHSFLLGSGTGQSDAQLIAIALAEGVAGPLGARVLHDILRRTLEPAQDPATANTVRLLLAVGRAERFLYRRPDALREA